MKFVYISIIIHSVTGIMFGAMNICIKYAVHFYHVNHNQFVILSMLFGSILGIFVGLFMSPQLSQLFSRKVFQINYPWFIIGVGSFSALLMSGKALSIGKIQITHIIISSYPFIQMLLEIIVFLRIPTVLQIILMFGLFWGICLIILNVIQLLLFEEADHTEEEQLVKYQNNSSETAGDVKETARSL